jgi:hypothetical protein
MAEPTMTDEHAEDLFSSFLGIQLHDDLGDVFHNAEEPLQDISEALNNHNTGFDTEEDDSEDIFGETFFETLESNGLGGQDKDDWRIPDHRDKEYWEDVSDPVPSSQKAIGAAVSTAFKRKRVREQPGTREESSLLHVWSSSQENESKEDAYDSSDEIHDRYAEPQEELPGHLKDNFLRSVQSQPNVASAVEMEESQFDVYGITEPTVEDPEMVKAALNELDQEINTQR